MKILRIIILIVTATVIYQVTLPDGKSVVDTHATLQMALICKWLNSNSTIKPQLGNLAHKKLNYLKTKYDGDFKCIILDDHPYQDSYSNAKAVMVYHQKINKLGLVYGLSEHPIKQFSYARYFQIWTPKDSGEDQYKNF